MNRLRNKVSKVWTSVRRVPEVVQGFIRDRMDNLPRNHEQTRQTGNFRNQIHKEAILEIGRQYDRTLIKRCTTLEKIYDILIDFGRQMQELNNSSILIEDHYLHRSGFDIFSLCSDTVYNVCYIEIFDGINDTRKKFKIYCKTLLALLNVRYGLRWVASLMLEKWAENAHACAVILSLVNSPVYFMDYEIERHLQRSLFCVYESKLRTLEADFISDMIQCLDMYVEEVDESVRPLVETLRARLTRLVPNRGARFHHPVQTIDLDLSSYLESE